MNANEGSKEMHSNVMTEIVMIVVLFIRDTVPE